MDRFLEAEISFLEDLVALDSDDEWLDLLVEKYAEKEEELAAASALRRARHFRLETWTEMQCSQQFRFPKGDLERLRRALRLPLNMYSPCRLSWTGLEGLCVVLRRLSSANRLADLESTFFRGRAALSVIFNQTLDFLYQEWSHLFDDLAHQFHTWLSPARMQEACQAVHGKAPLNNVWGFLDGTRIPICKPKRHQHIWYSGHKKKHLMKFQSVMVPHGIFVHLFGPFEGRRHDASMLRASGLVGQLQQHANMPGGGVYSLYADTAYPLMAHILSAYRRGAGLTLEQQQFNTEMSRVRSSVEWGFGGVQAQFAHLSMRQTMRINLQPIGQYFVVGTLLYNCMTCLHGNQVSKYFELDPPSLEEYLR